MCFDQELSSFVLEPFDFIQELFDFDLGQQYWKQCQNLLVLSHSIMGLQGLSSFILVMFHLQGLQAMFRSVVGQLVQFHQLEELGQQLEMSRSVLEQFDSKLDLQQAQYHSALAQLVLFHSRLDQHLISLAVLCYQQIKLGLLKLLNYHQVGQALLDQHQELDQQDLQQALD